MSTLLRFFLDRWVLSALGLGTVGLLIWFVGAEIAVFNVAPLQSPAARALVILLVILVWALIQWRKTVVANRASREIADSLVGSKDESEQRESTAVDSSRQREEIRERFEQAVAVLKKSKAKHGGRLNLYQMPWYIVIGPPGCGKTTALTYSGLRFPLANKLGEKLRGVGGTRNCDFWFSDEAVLLDTAGRFTTQDSQAEADRAAWQTFLDELKRKRPRRPINGVIVAISTHDLLTLSKESREEQAHKVRNRIDELYERFGMRFPIYVMFTKCDLLAGFTQFFADLGEKQRAQVWGATFSIDDSDSTVGATSRFSAEFRILVKRLTERVLSRMENESDPRLRASICEFPVQFAAMEKTIEDFLRLVFEGSAYERPPMLRGVYFSSGTQQGTPIDRLLSTVMRTFGLDAEAQRAQAGMGKSYFIKALLQDVIFEESEIAGTNRRLEAQRAWLQRAAYAGSAVFVCAAILLWAVSYASNRAYVAEVRESAERVRQTLVELPAGNRDLSLVLPALEAARRLPGGYDERDTGTPWLSGFGLSQRKTLGAQASRTYLDVSRQLLLPRLMLRLEDQLRAGGSVPDYQYEGLKVYLMLDSRAHYDAAGVVRWFEADLRNTASLGMSAAQRETMVEHVRALFAEQPRPLPQSLDETLIDQTQRAVSRLPLEGRIYGRLKRSDAVTALPRFSLFNAAGPLSQAVFRRAGSADSSDGIEGLFTREGYRTVFVRQVPLIAAGLVDEGWVLGPYAAPAMDSARVLERVKDLYLEEFSQRYQSFLLELELAPFATLDEAADILRILSNPTNSPLLRLFEAVAAETRLEGADPVAAAAAAAQQQFENLIGVAGDGQAGAGEARNLVEERFSWVADLVAGDPGSAPIGHVLSLLEELYRFMLLMSNEAGRQGEIPLNVADRGRSVIQQIEAEASRQPPMLTDLLTKAAGSSRSLAFSGVAAHINNEWRSGPLQFCRNVIMGRYPVARESTREIALADFGRFFGPGGLIDSFFAEYLADHVDQSAPQWRMRGAAAAPINLSANTLRQFQRAAVIRDTFFRGGGSSPAVLFDLKPVHMDANLTMFTLVWGADSSNPQGARRISYSFGPQITEYLEWPGPQQSAEVRIELTPPTAAGSSMQRESGPWAWFRILDRAVIRPGPTTDTFEIEFDLDGRPVLYELVVRGANNPFRLAALEEFSCLDAL